MSNLTSTPTTEISFIHHDWSTRISSETSYHPMIGELEAMDSVLENISNISQHCYNLHSQTQASPPCKCTLFLNPMTWEKLGFPLRIKLNDWRFKVIKLNNDNPTLIDESNGTYLDFLSQYRSLTSMACEALVAHHHFSRMQQQVELPFRLGNPKRKGITVNQAIEVIRTAFPRFPSINMGDTICTKREKLTMTLNFATMERQVNVLQTDLKEMPISQLNKFPSKNEILARKDTSDIGKRPRYLETDPMVVASRIMLQNKKQQSQADSDSDSDSEISVVAYVSKQQAQNEIDLLRHPQPSTSQSTYPQMSTAETSHSQASTSNGLQISPKPSIEERAPSQDEDNLLTSYKRLFIKNFLQDSRLATAGRKRTKSLSDLSNELPPKKKRFSS